MKKHWRSALMISATFAMSALAQADTIYLCKAYGRGTFWTNGTCSSKSAFIERIASVPSLPFDQQVDIAKGQMAEAAGHTTHTTTVTNTYINNTNIGPKLGTKAVCDALNAQVSSYDSMARQPQSGSMQDWIRAERKKVRDEQFSLRC